MKKIPKTNLRKRCFEYQSEKYKREGKTGEEVGATILDLLLLKRGITGKPNATPQSLKTLGGVLETEIIVAQTPRKVSTGGLRNEKPLTESQKAEALEYAKKLGISENDVVFSENMNTSYKLLFGKDRLYIGTDVLPATEKSLKANSRISMKGAIAHELEGHRKAEIAGKTNVSELLEEVQASIRAAICS